MGVPCAIVRDEYLGGVRFHEISARHPETEHPDLLGVAFDPKGGSFRREIFPEYKANRAETPEDILLSVPYVKRIVEAMCIPVLEVPGYEADDVIGTLAHKGRRGGLRRFHGYARQGLRTVGVRQL